MAGLPFQREAFDGKEMTVKASLGTKDISAAKRQIPIRVDSRSIQFG
jgi:hypothetical protein